MDEVTNITPNSDNEYFEQTLDDDLLEKVKESQAGKRTWEFKHSPDNTTRLFYQAKLYPKHGQLRLGHAAGSSNDHLQ